VEVIGACSLGTNTRAMRPRTLVAGARAGLRYSSVQDCYTRHPSPQNSPYSVAAARG
jgi:hypothetical protein